VKDEKLRDRLLLLGLVLIVAIPLALVLSGFARQVIVVPLLYVVWVGRLLVQSIPQFFLWAGFLLIVLILAARSLRAQRSTTKRRRRAREGLEGTTGYSGQVAVWARRVHLAAGGSYYYRWYLAQQLGKLAQDVLAYRRRLAPTQTRPFVTFSPEGSGRGSDIPPEVRAYLEASWRATLPRPARLPFISRLLHHLRLRPEISPLDLDPEQVVQFLERELEVGHQLED
jgi:hypothetical protein